MRSLLFCLTGFACAAYLAVHHDGFWHYYGLVFMAINAFGGAASLLLLSDGPDRARCVFCNGTGKRPADPWPWRDRNARRVPCEYCQPPEKP